MHASPVAAVGDIQSSDHWNGAALLPFTVAEADPFAAVNVPTFTGCHGSSNRINISNPHDVVDRSADTGIQCVSDISVSGTLQLGSATYVIDGGGFSAGAQAHVSCTGCTIILTNSDPSTSATIGSITNINGGAQLNMSAPDTGAYKGLLFYQDRRAAPGTTNSINGNSDSLLTGALYFPNQQLDINGTSNLTFSCAQFVARDVSFSVWAFTRTVRSAKCHSPIWPSLSGQAVTTARNSIVPPSASAAPTGTTPSTRVSKTTNRAKRASTVLLRSLAGSPCPGPARPSK